MLTKDKSIIMGKQIYLSVFLMLLCIGLVAQTTTVNYTPSADANILNPERGFYTPTITYASNYTPLNASDLYAVQNLHTPYNANYQVSTSLIFRYFVLDDFVNSAISTSFLTKMQQDLDIIRSTGMKCIIRFSYVNEANTGTCGSWICSPYGDASKSRILNHIAQLKPYFESNKDIITAVQMGFIGVWGENYYTDHFGDASQSPYILTNTNWQDRNEVLGALVNAVPIERMVQARYPQAKQRYVYGIGAPTSSPALTPNEAHNGSAKARIGFHNDCFLASDDDFGTFTDYGPPSSQSDTTNLKSYKENDSKYLVVGGETCFINNPDDNCIDNGGRADYELRRFHYSYLNSEYNNDVNNDWTNNCLDEIKKNLGYRIELCSGTYPNSAIAGQTIDVNISLKNEGYAAPYNERGLQLVLRSLANGKNYFAKLSPDPRDWHTGNHYINETLCLPPNLPSGNYEMLLSLPDPMPSLFNRYEYAIQCANMNTWEFNTGFNRLGHNLTVINNHSSLACSGETMFTSTSFYDPDYCPDVLNINGSIPTDTYIADDQINSDGHIDFTENAYFQADQAIFLLPDFTVELGAGLIIVNENCK